MSKSESIIKDAAKFTAGGYISSFLNFITAVIVRRILSPVFMGIYTELALVFEYAKYSHLGIIDSLDRQIPYYNGKKEFNTVEEIKNVGISFSLFTSFICVLIIAIFSCFLRDGLSPLLSAGLKVVAVMVIAQVVTSFYVTLVRTHHLFGPLSRYVVVVAIFDLALKLILGIKFGVIGILWATVLTLAAGIAYLFKTTDLHFRVTLRIPMKVIASLFAIGFPLLLAGFTFTVLRSIDRIMIIALLTREDLGYYSIAVMMYSFVFQLPNLIYTVLFPRFYEAFGSAGDNVDKIRGYLEKPTLVFAYLFPVLIGLTAIFVPLLVNYTLPRYTQGIAPALILLFGMVFISLTNMSSFLLIALKKQNVLIIIGVLCIVISAVFNFIFVKIFHLGIRGIALASALTYFLYSFILIGYAVRQYIDSLYKRMLFFLNLYLPFLWILFIFCIFHFVFTYTLDNLAADLGKAFLQAFILLIMSFPLLALANRKTELYSRIRNAGLNFFKK